MRWFPAIIVAVAVVVPAAHGQMPGLETRAVQIQQPPLIISNAHAGWEPPPWASEAHKQNPVGTEVPVLPLYFQVQNVSQKNVWAYRIMVVLYDAFGDYIDTLRASAIWALAPQASDYGRWSVAVRHPHAAFTMLYYLEAVRYEDGTSWRIDPESVAVRVPAAAPAVRFHAWHIIPDPREVLPQQLKDAG